MRNLARLTNAANRLEAWKDWNKLAAKVIEAGYEEMVLRHKPSSGAGWRTIDKKIASLRKEFSECVFYALPDFDAKKIRECKPIKRE